MLQEKRQNEVRRLRFGLNDSLTTFVVIAQ